MTRADSPAEPDELGQLYDRLGTALFRYAVMIVANRTDAEDAVHQAFVAVLARGLRGVEHIDAYLRRAVRNACYDTLRKRGRAASDEPLHLEALPGRTTDPIERLMLERALGDLPAEQREVVELKIFEGWTFQEIAALTDEPMNTVASRYRYALAKLGTALAKRRPS